MTNTPDFHSPSDRPWLQHGWVELTQTLLDSYARLIGQELIPRRESAVEDARELYLAPRIVVAHGTQDDPVLCYGNQAALDLWQMDVQTLLTTPSRLTAEPVHRDERAQLLERTTRDGYVDDYQGVRISSSGRRFRIHQATVWNLFDQELRRVGQAATFAEWTFLDELPSPAGDSP